MGTIVTVEIVGHDESPSQRADRDAAIDRAFDWFRQVESVCSRFDPASELMRVVARPGTPVVVSEMLFRAVEFACAMAEETNGAFDPTVGRVMEQRGFDRHYATGERANSRIASDDASWRDVRFDADRQTISIERPLVLDLGAVAKGLAIDLAARELTPFANFAIDAGGDIYLAGCRPGGEPWTVGIRHPREVGALLGTLRISDRAVCTSGDYERRTVTGEGHIFDPRAGSSARGVASVTAVASSAMVADAAGTAAFVLGPPAGLALFDRLGIDGIIVDHELRSFTTTGMADAFLPHA